MRCNVGWICLFGCQLGKAGHPGTQLGNDDSETNTVYQEHTNHLFSLAGLTKTRDTKYILDIFINFD